MSPNARGLPRPEGNCRSDRALRDTRHPERSCSHNSLALDTSLNGVTYLGGFLLWGETGTVLGPGFLPGPLCGAVDGVPRLCGLTGTVFAMLCSSCMKQKLNGRPQTAARMLILYYTLKLPSSASGTRRRSLDEADFVIGQAVEFIDKPVDLVVGQAMPTVRPLEGFARPNHSAGATRPAEFFFGFDFGGGGGGGGYPLRRGGIFAGVGPFRSGFAGARFGVVRFGDDFLPITHPRFWRRRRSLELIRKQRARQPRRLDSGSLEPNALLRSPCRSSPCQPV